MNLFGYYIGKKTKKSDINVSIPAKENYEIKDYIDTKILADENGNIFEISATIYSNNIDSHLANVNVLKNYLIEQGMRIPSLEEFYGIEEECIRANSYLYTDDVLCEIEYCKRYWLSCDFFILKIKLYKENVEKNTFYDENRKQVKFAHILNHTNKINVFNCILGGFYKDGDNGRVNCKIKNSIQDKSESIDFVPYYCNKNILIGAKFIFKCNENENCLDVHRLILEEFQKYLVKRIYEGMLENWNISVYEIDNYTIVFKTNIISNEIVFEIRYKDYFIKSDF